jgi:prolyl-tRNA synthetase
VTIDSWEKFKKSEGKWIRALHCGSMECEKAIKEETGIKTNCIPFEQPKKLGKCVRCGKKANYLALFARSY